MTFMSVIGYRCAKDDLARWPVRAQGRRMTFTSRLRAAWDASNADIIGGWRLCSVCLRF
jgi:hypothetical protein